MTPLLKLMTVAIKKVTNNVIRDFSELEYLVTNPASAERYASNTQDKILEVVYQDLVRLKPNYSFQLGDRLIKGKDSSNCFHVHGIDNLYNFSQNLCYFSINLTLIRDSLPVASVCYNPILNSIFYAEKGGGSFWNQKRLRYRKKESGLTAVNQQVLSDQKLEAKQILITNSLALDLCYLAAGKYKQVIYDNLDIKLQNVLPGILVAEEAGIVLNKTLAENSILSSLSSND